MAVSARSIFSLNQMQTKQKYGTIVFKSFKWKSNADIWCENPIKSQTCFVYLLVLKKKWLTMPKYFYET
jgi:hypothetical protein